MKEQLIMNENDDYKTIIIKEEDYSKTITKFVVGSKEEALLNKIKQAVSDYKNGL